MVGENTIMLDSFGACWLASAEVDCNNNGVGVGEHWLVVEVALGDALVVLLGSGANGGGSGSTSEMVDDRSGEGEATKDGEAGWDSEIVDSVISLGFAETVNDEEKVTEDNKDDCT